MSLIPDEEYIQLYDLFKRLMGDSDESNKLVIYHPELFVEMAKEIVRLRAEVSQLKVSLGANLMQREYADRLYDQLQCIKRDLNEMGIRLPYSFR